MFEKIQVGEHVRVMLKKTKTFTKDHDPKFSTEIYTVTHVGKEADI